jgi:hypothetical protein
MRAMSRFRGADWAALGTAVLAASIFAAPARAATVVGQAPPITGTPTTCGPGTSFVQTAVATGPSYAVPAGGGVITAWRYAAAAEPNRRIGLGVYTRQGMTSIFTVVAEDFEPSTPSILNAFAVRIPVAGGELIGLRTTGASNVTCAYLTATSGDIYYSRMSPPLNAPTDFGGFFGPSRLDVAAVVEPDADHDGYGDESQDCAATDARRHDDCTPPVSKLLKHPKRETHSQTAKFTFTSDDPNASFQCKLDRKKFRLCTSPRKLKHLKPRRHRFQVRGIDRVGNLGAGAKFRWRVLAD